MSKVHTIQPGFYGAGSLEISPPTVSGESGVRRLANCKDALIKQPADGIETVYDIVSYAARTHGDRNALGWRDVVQIVEEEKDVTKVVDGQEVVEKKKWKYFELSDYKYLSYLDVEAAVSEISRGLVSLGLSKGDVFNIYAETSPNWPLVSYACCSVSITIATSYDTLGEEGLTHSLNEPECVGVFTNAALLATLLRVLPKTPTVNIVVYDGKPDESALDRIRAVRDTIKLMSLDELRVAGRAIPTDGLDARVPKKEDVALIMYTSGSTGNPKGVVLTHANLVASVGGVHVLLKHHLVPGDSYIAYLPLAHIFEFVVELFFFYSGLPIGYGRAKTLTDASVRNCKGDFNALRPSIMVGVPAVWENIRKGILAKVHAGGTIKKNIFNGAYAAKKNNVPVLTQIADAIVFPDVKAATGGRLRIAMNGAAAISQETQEFLCTALVPVVQGYGMTESLCAMLPPELQQCGAVGLPIPCVEIKLLDVPDAGYLASNQQGEICVRGPSVTSGYYKRPDLNSDETIFAKGGWLRTGDVGRWNADGTLSIIDRLKNLVKLAHGEYIALERLESIYKSCNLVANICVYASQDAQQPMAIVIPHAHHLQTYLVSKDMESSRELADICNDPAVAGLVLKECNVIGKKNGFKQFELLQAVVLTSEEWTPESGLLTAAQKIQRTKIAKAFKDRIDTVYKRVT